MWVPVGGRVPDASAEGRPRKVSFTICACSAVFALTETSEFKLLRGIRTRWGCFLALGAFEEADPVYAIRRDRFSGYPFRRVSTSDRVEFAFPAGLVSLLRLDALVTPPPCSPGPEARRVTDALAE